MKYIIISLFVLCYSVSAQTQEIVNGPLMSGSTSSIEYIGEANGGERMTLVRLKLFGDFQCSESLRYYFDVDKSGTKKPNSFWLRNAEDIVRYGVMDNTQTTLLLPKPQYGIDYAISVTGALVVNTPGEIKTAKGGVSFTYDDPFTHRKAVDNLSITLTFDPKLPLAGRVYKLQAKVKDAFIDSNDSIFIGNIDGSISVNADLFVGKYKGSKLTYNYDLTAQNITKPQGINFMNWWVNCVLPTL